MQKKNTYCIITCLYSQLYGVNVIVEIICYLTKNAVHGSGSIQTYGGLPFMSQTDGIPYGGLNGDFIRKAHHRLKFNFVTNKTK